MQDHDEDDALLLEFDSEASGRTAVIADEGDSVWLYLTDSEQPEIERDCWLFNTPSAPAEPDPADYEARSAPPPAPAHFISAEGKRTLPEEGSFRVRWSADGHSVAVLLDGAPLGVATMTEERGLSRYLLEAGAWGRPWDEARFELLFGDGA
jgi:hypothetical protein